MADPAQYLLLVNPSAGGGSAKELLPRMETALLDHGLGFRRVFTTSLEHGCEEARAAAAAGETTLVLSGDGLIGQVGGALANTGGTLGILPGGRGNDLARVLEIPTEPEGSVAVVAGGATREIDVGEINGTRFLGIASCGFDSDANRIANEAKLVRGQLVYLYAALKALAGWKPATFSLTLDGRKVEVRGYSVGAANNKAYGGGMYAAPDAELDDGLLDVVSLEDLSKWRFLTQVLPKVRNGTAGELAESSTHRAAEVIIEADRPFAVYADGDHAADLPATLTVLPRALRVLVPA
jgi:YegS/Rv2252/BmrU family lipid kinase